MLNTLPSFFVKNCANIQSKSRIKWTTNRSSVCSRLLPISHDKIPQRSFIRHSWVFKLSEQSEITIKYIIDVLSLPYTSPPPPPPYHPLIYLAICMIFLYLFLYYQNINRRSRTAYASREVGWITLLTNKDRNLKLSIIVEGGQGLRNYRLFIRRKRMTVQPSILHS